MDKHFNFHGWRVISHFQSAISFFTNTVVIGRSRSIDGKLIF